MKREFQIPGHNLRGTISLDVEKCVCVYVCGYGPDIYKHLSCTEADPETIRISRQICEG